MNSAPRTVQCYHCQRPFDVPPRAMSISCPWCYKRVTLDDLIVTDTCWTSRVQTCGRLIVHRKGSLVSSCVEANAGMEIHGGVEGKLISGGPVFIGKFAQIRGDLIAPCIDIENGAVVNGGRFTITAPARSLQRDGPTMPGREAGPRKAGTNPVLRPVIRLPGVFKGLRPT